MANQSILSLFHSLKNAKSTDDVLKDGNFNYIVEKRPHEVTVNLPDGTVKKLVSEFSAAAFRGDINTIIGSIGVGFGLVQNREVVEFCQAFCTSGDADFYGAVAPNLGEKVYVLMKQPKFVDIGCGDEIHSYFCVTAAHNGSGCLNPIPLYVRKASQTIITPPYSAASLKIRHTKNVQANIAKAKKVIGRIGAYFEEYMDNFVNFSKVNLSDEEAMFYLKLVIEDPENDPTRAENARNRIFELYKGKGRGSSLPTCKDTLFGAMLAITEYADDMLTVRNSKLKDEVSARIHSRLEGSGAELKAKAIAMSHKLQEMHKKGGGCLTVT